VDSSEDVLPITIPLSSDHGLARPLQRERSVEATLAVHVLPGSPRLLRLHGPHIGRLVLNVGALGTGETEGNPGGLHCLHLLRSDVRVEIHLPPAQPTLSTRSLRQAVHLRS
jgi:hypothetical protein